MADIREALHFSLATSSDTALQMSSDLRPVWLTTGTLSEGRRWLDLALAAASPQPSAARIRALANATLITAYQGDLAAARLRIDEARRLLAVVDDPEVGALVDCLDGHLALLRGDLAYVRRCGQKALAAAADPEVQFWSTGALGWAFDYSGDLDQALHWFERGLALAESRGESVWRSRALWIIGLVRWRQGQQEAAERVLHQALQLAHLINDPINGAQALEGLAWLAGAKHQAHRAVLLMAAAAAVNRASGTLMFVLVHVKGFHERCAERARGELGEQQFQAVWDQGALLTFDEAVALALHDDD